MRTTFVPRLLLLSRQTIVTHNMFLSHHFSGYPNFFFSIFFFVRHACEEHLKGREKSLFALLCRMHVYVCWYSLIVFLFLFFLFVFFFFFCFIMFKWYVLFSSIPFGFWSTTTGAINLFHFLCIFVFVFAIGCRLFGCLHSVRLQPFNMYK